MRIGTPFGAIESRGIECGTVAVYGGGEGAPVSGLVETNHTDEPDYIHAGAQQLRKELVLVGEEQTPDDKLVADYTDPTDPTTTGYIQIPDDPNGYSADPVGFDIGTVNGTLLLAAVLSNSSNSKNQTFAVWNLSTVDADGYHPYAVYNCNNLLDSVGISTAQGLKGCAFHDAEDILMLSHGSAFASTETLISAVDLSDSSNVQIVDYVPNGSTYDSFTVYPKDGDSYAFSGGNTQFFVEYDGGIQKQEVDFVDNPKSHDFNAEIVYEGTSIFDISDPLNPTKVGELPAFEGAYPDGLYVRYQRLRGHPRNDTLYAEIGEGTNVGVRALDVSDRANPTVLSDTLIDPHTEEMDTGTTSTTVHTTVNRGNCLARTLTESGDIVTGLLEHNDGIAYIPFEEAPEPDKVAR